MIYPSTISVCHTTSYTLVAECYKHAEQTTHNTVSWLQPLATLLAMLQGLLIFFIDLLLSSLGAMTWGNLNLRIRIRIRIYLLARRNLLWDILRLPSSCRAALARPICHSHTMTRTGCEPATIRIAA